MHPIKTLFLLSSLCAVLGLCAPAFAQSYPSKPIKILVGFPPGGGLDFTTRLLAPYLSEALGQTIVVENKAGAAGVLAHSEIARAAPDGYTLIIGNIGPLALAPNMMDRRPYEPTKDFTAIGQVVATYFVAAVPAGHPAGSLKAFVEWAKKNEGKVNYASGGNGSITHLNGELLNEIGGIKMTHVPYKGTALAVTSPSRDPDLPDVPTAGEAGFPSLATSGWQGLIGPAGMSREVVQRLYGALRSALAKPEVRERFAKAGTPVMERDPEAFGAFIKAENERWLPLIKASGAKIQ